MTPYMRAANVKWTGIDTSDVKEMDFTLEEAAVFELKSGDVLVGEASGSKSEVGKSAVWQDEVPGACFQNTLIRVRPFQVTTSEYVQTHLTYDARRGALASLSKGVGIHHLSAKGLAGWEISLPPLNEQRRIVSKIEALTARSRRAKEALDSVPALLDKLRQSILGSAFRGDLTADWRAKHPDVEPASVLLERIRAERRRRWEEATLAKLTASGKPPKTNAWKDKYQEPEPVDTDGLPELPEGWAWATVEELCSLVTDGDHNPPKRVPSGIPHLTSKNIKRSRISFEGCSFVSAEGFEQTRARYEPTAGDVVVTCVGTVGEVAEIPPGLVFSADRNLAAVRPTPAVTSSYLCRSLQSPLTQQRFRGASGATAQPHLYLRDLRATAVPVAPAEEQEQLVQQIAALTSSLERLSSLTSGTLSQYAAMSAAILAKAFRGELVPQDPNDEPASVLLERIRAERESADAKPKQTPATKKRSTKRKPN